MNTSGQSDKFRILHLQDSEIPFCLINDHLNIIYSNQSFKTMVFGNDETVQNQSTGIFDIRAVEKILPFIKNSDSTHSWNGIITHKRPGASEQILNTMIFPVETEPHNNPANRTFSCFFADETDLHKKNLRSVFTSLLEASKLKDNDTGHHIERVNHYSLALAKALQNEGWKEVTDDFLDNIGFLAAMHDVGKIGVPDDILNKPARLEGWERKIMEEHTINGAYILNHYPDTMARDIARAHHEWWDGTGYPHGVFGEMIPLPARIVAIADVYDALRSKRVYKEAIDHEETMMIMRSNKGKQFQKELFDVFEKISGEFELIFKNLDDL